jgi:A/G-specific adenine glycosylase
VLSRLTGENGNVDSEVVRKRLRAVANAMIDPRRPGEFNQGLMELGATVCLPKQPQCLLCPLVGDCNAYQVGRQNELPLKSARPSPMDVEKQLLVIEKAGMILAWRRPAESSRLAGFWELPEPALLPRAKMRDQAARFRHTIVNTNYSYNVFRASLVRVPKNFEWLPKDKLHEVPLSTAAKKALACLDKQEAQAGR